jgi:hypothetical protein
LMISGILRIYFWFESGYAINLLFQAMFIIIVQVIDKDITRHCYLINVFNCHQDLKIMGRKSHSGDGIPLMSMVVILGYS